MTERLGSGDRQRGRARITLGVLVLALVTLAAANVLPSLLNASAQAQASPTSTNTAGGGSTSPGPAPTPTGPQIEFVNPSKYAKPEYVSDKPDEDNDYHLVAWTFNAPADARVEFEIKPPNENAMPIGAATRVGTDTWELFWDLPPEGQLPDGPYELIANLYSGGASPSPSPTPSGSPSASPSESPSPSPSASASPSNPPPLDSDTEEVEVDRTKDTVEITKPRNGGRLGRYDPDGAAGPRRPGFVIEVATSEEAEDVRVFYSTSQPGTEPSWVTCDQQITIAFDDDTRRIGCTFPESQGTITAVAAVVLDHTPRTGTPVGNVCTPPVCTPASTTTESGDAHRVIEYTVDPRVMSVEPAAPRPQAGSCQELTATVRDQDNEPVWRANVDVHATGPTDALKFAETENTDGFQAPDGGGHSGNEFAWDCEAEDETSDERQAEESRFQAPDEKHIESLVNPNNSSADPRGEGTRQEGTDLDGTWVFALHSPHQGTTQVVAWADEDDDDVNDNPGDPGVDPQDNATITWTQPSPTPASPSGTPTGTATGTPTGTATATTPSATGTGSPTGTATTSPTASASPSPSPSQLTLNCDPETDSNPVRTSHSILCRVNQASGSPSPSPGGASGFRIHAEATGANDPDGTDTPESPDFTCVTGDDGTCSFTHGPGGTGNTNDTGPTLYRAWIDTGNDSAVEADRTEGRDEFQQPGQKQEEDDTDVMEKAWQRAPLDCDPEQDGNPTGTAHTITCRASTAGGGARSGVNIDVEATGVNDPDNGDTQTTPDFTCTTDQNGTCSVTHGPGGTGSEGTTRYRAWVDADSSDTIPESDASEGRNENTEPGQVVEPDETDVVDKTWTRMPTALAMQPEGDTASVGTCNAFTITVTGDGQPIGGVLVDVEQRHERADNQTNNDEPRVAFCTPRASDGPNPSGVDQTQGDLDPPDESPDNPGTLGGETLTPTDSQGRVTIGITVEPANGSDGSGNVAVTAFFETDDDNDPEAGEPQDSSTKTWVVPEGRTITCEPESATNPVNTQHRVTCTVRDRFGAPVEGEGVTFTESGPGDFTSRGSRTNANGQVVAVTTSSEGGNQTITATLDDDLQGGEPGEVDECDRAAGNPAGSPEGACSDTVDKTWVPSATSPTQFSRDVTIEASRNRVLFNRTVTLSGTVESDAAAPTACTQFVEVRILRDVVGGPGEFEPFATEQTDAEGAYSHSFRGDLGATYVAEIDELAECEGATSGPEPVLVKVKVSLRLSDSNVPRGKRVRFTVRTAPCPETARDRVMLFRAIDGEFGKVGSKRSNDRCSKSFRRRVRNDSVFQGRWPKQAPEFLAGKSRSKVVRVHNRRR